MWRTVRRFLQKPTVVIGELAAIALASVLGATIPQSGTATAGAIEMFRAPVWVASVVDLLGLDQIFSSAWFLTLVALAGCSLSLALNDQWRRAWRLWRRRGGSGKLSGAPFRYEVEVPLSEPLRERRVCTRDSLRLGLWGSPLFHLGLWLLVAAGLLRLLFGTDAVVDLVVGETLPPSPSAYGAQWPGLLARPFSLQDPLTLLDLQVETYPGGSLQQFSAEVEVGGERRTVAINAPLSSGAEMLYLTSTYGPAVQLVTDLGGALEGHTLLLYVAPGGRYSGELVLSNGVRILATARKRLDPAKVELRVLQGGALLAFEQVKPGETIQVSGSRVLVLRGIVKWSRFTAQRDVSVPVAYTGFALACAGAFLMYGVIRVESAIVWDPTPTGVRLKVAMRPQRFAPLFAPRFEQLVAESRAELKTLGGEVDVSIHA